MPQTRAALRRCIEHRLHVGRRAADDAEHLGCCGLMLQRLAQLCVRSLNFLEQAHVFDRDHCLIGESLKKLDLLISEGPYFRSADNDRSDGHIFAEQWRSQTVRVPPNPPELLASGNFGFVSRCKIMYVYRLLVNDRSAAG